MWNSNSMVHKRPLKGGWNGTWVLFHHGPHEAQPTPPASRGWTMAPFGAESVLETSAWAWDWGVRKKSLPWWGGDYGFATWSSGLPFYSVTVVNQGPLLSLSVHSLFHVPTAYNLINISPYACQVPSELFPLILAGFLLPSVTSCTSHSSPTSWESGSSFYSIQGTLLQATQTDSG